MDPQLIDVAWSVDGSLANMGAATPVNTGTISSSTEIVHGQIDLRNAPLGLHALSVSGRTLAGAALALAPAPALQDLAGAQPSDWFVRGPDLVAVYERTSQRPLRLLFQWTRIPGQPDRGLLGGMELVLSVQTDELDSLPELALRSTMPSKHVNVQEFAAEESSESEPFDDAVRAYVFQLDSGAYVEFAHPRFGVHSACDAASVSHCLFQRRLEKGVILRSRIQGLFFRDDNLSPIRDFALRFAAEPLPLTA